MPIFRPKSARHFLVWTALTVTAVVGILFFGLRTKGLRLNNAAVLNTDENAIVFSNHSMAYVEDMGSVRRSESSRGFTIALVARAGSFARGRLRSLLMLNGGSDAHQLILWQWGDTVIAMNGDDYDNTKRRPRIEKRQAFTKAEAKFITITADSKGSRLYIDGSLVRQRRAWQLTVPRQGPNLYMVLGNTVDGKYGWAGTLYGLAMYATALPQETIARQYHQWQDSARFPYDTKELLAAYTFEAPMSDRVPDLSGNQQALILPDQPVVLKKTFLHPQWQKFKPNRAFFIDSFWNFIGFIPLGAVVFVWLKSFLALPDKRMMLAAIGFCFLLSLGIEILQAWLPKRDSNLLDLTFNTCGAWAGLYLSKKVISRGTVS